jgi:shikimate dehydrogenase
MRKFGLIGYPLGHSFSKKYFEAKFEKEGIKDCLYDLYEIEDITLFPKIVKENPELS